MTIEKQNKNPGPKNKSPVRNRTAIKMISLLTLTLLLLIPLGMVKSVLHERIDRRDAAVRELSSTWGNRQELIGPVLVVPFKHRSIVHRDVLFNGKTSTSDEMKESIAHAFFLPKTFHLDGKLDPQTLSRGIYEAVVYRGELHISGTFDPPALDRSIAAPEDILWDDAYIAIGISDLRGAQDALTISWMGERVALEPVTGLTEIPSGVRTHRKGMIKPESKATFELALHLSGSTSIRVAPVGERNEVRLHSTWPDPSFQGSILPTARKVSEKGFEADWKSSYYDRSYPQKWTTIDSVLITRNNLIDSMFGVDLLSMVDHYRLVERAIKYGILFVVLVFTAFFLSEILGKLRIHPFQYTMVGAALSLFYLVLLSLSEFLAFGISYAIGAVACSAMIALYSSKVLHNRRLALVIAMELATIYGILFVILRMLDYSLLFGTAGLFIALSLVMFITRNIDWYVRDEE